MTLTNDQLKLLTERTNDRLDEFAGYFDHVTPGLVRLIHAVIEEWWNEDTPLHVGEAPPLPPVERTPEDDLLTIAYGVGYERGKEAAKPVPVSEQAIAALGPEHTVVTPFKERNGHNSKPDPDTARANIATALATGSHASLVATINRPKTLAEMDDDASKRSGKWSSRYQPTLDEVLAELKRQSMGGVMPSQAAFDNARPANWSTAQAHCARLEMTWRELAEHADLRPHPFDRRKENP